MIEKQNHLTTEEFSARLGIKGNTVRRGLCIQGHYLGIVPIKLPNGRLLWPTEPVRRLLNQSAA